MGQRSNPDQRWRTSLVSGLISARCSPPLDHAAAQPPPSPRSSAAHGRSGRGQPCNRSRSPDDALSVTVRKQAACGAGSARSGVDRDRSGFDHAAIAGMELPNRTGARLPGAFRTAMFALPCSLCRVRARVPDGVPAREAKRSGPADRAPVRAARSARQGGLTTYRKSSHTESGKYELAGMVVAAMVDSW